MTTPKEAPLWRCEIKYGPEGEVNYAWIYDADGEMVCTARTHHAEAIVTRMNALASLQGEDAVERVARIRLIASKCFDPTGFEVGDAPVFAVAEWKAAESALDAILAAGLVAQEALQREYERGYNDGVEWQTVHGEASVRADEREKCAKFVLNADFATVYVDKKARQQIAAAIRSGGGE